MKTREQVALNVLADNPWQPRQNNDADELRELADNIRQLGLLQVPLARISPTRPGLYELAFGHRRVAACRLFQRQGHWGNSIEIDVRGISDEDMAVIALSENIQRKQLTSIEVVRAHKRAIEETNLTVRALSDRLDMSRPNLTNDLRVLETPDVVLEHMESGTRSLRVAREFLVLQHAGHIHLEDMRQVVRTIISVHGRRGIPDWRRHVRERIYLAVAYNDKDWRPLGPKPDHTVGGANQEANFGVEGFKNEFPDSLHTISAVSKSEVVHFEEQITCDASWPWTWEVKESSSWKSRATREANRAVEIAGAAPAAKKKNDHDSQLGEVLAKDSVWQKIAAGREKKGPHRPVTDEERELLGTRAELREMSAYGRNPFWKVLEIEKASHPRRWKDKDSGPLPPFFPDLKGCMQCTADAAYVKSNGYHPVRNQVRLACFNRSCYNEKIKADTAEGREKLETHKKDLFREDREMAQGFVRELESVGMETLYALATTMLAHTQKLQMQHPFGEYDADWSYEARSTARAREILGLERGTGEYHLDFLDGNALEALDRVNSLGDLRELVANLMVHHLRISGRIDSISWGTPV